tara:strand:+ start:1752 stop:2282 length:531 start_codon:yes stop_codon:yes gene_type:complete
MHINLINKYYFINNFDTNIIDKQDKQTTVIYRNYNSKIMDQDLILKIKKYCKLRKIKFYLSNNIKLAIKLDLDGAYIPSFNKSTKHLAYSLKKKFKIIGSAHNIKEIKTKEIQKVNSIFVSSLFKRNKNYLGVNKFKLISNLTKKKVVALGGISKDNLNKLRLLNNCEFAGISFFE